MLATLVVRSKPAPNRAAGRGASSTWDTSWTWTDPTIAPKTASNTAITPPRSRRRAPLRGAGSRRTIDADLRNCGSRVTTSSGRDRAGRNRAQRQKTHQEKWDAYDRNALAPTVFVYAGGVNSPALMVTPTATYRLVKDHLGSVRLVVDVATGAIVQELAYDAWGRVLVDTNPGFQPFGYAGGLYDADTGLVRFGERDYDAETGRWTSKDPIGLGGGLNVYAYVEGDPVNAFDPSGRWPVLNPAELAGALAGGVANLTAFIINEAAHPSGQSTPTLLFNARVAADAGAIAGASSADPRIAFVGGAAASVYEDLMMLGQCKTVGQMGRKAIFSAFANETGARIGKYYDVETFVTASPLKGAANAMGNGDTAVATAKAVPWSVFMGIGGAWILPYWDK